MQPWCAEETSFKNNYTISKLFNGTFYPRTPLGEYESITDTSCVLSPGAQRQCDSRGSPRSEPRQMGRWGQRGRRGRLGGACVDIRRRRGMNLLSVIKNRNVRNYSYYPLGIIFSSFTSIINPILPGCRMKVEVKWNLSEFDMFTELSACCSSLLF